MEDRDSSRDGVATFVGLEDLARDDAPPPVLPDDIGAGLPDLPSGRMLDPEPRSQKRVVRFMAVGGLTLSVAYLVWRVLFTVEMSAWFVAIPLMLLEMQHAVGLGMSTYSLWDVDPVPGWHAVEATGHRVALLVQASGQDAEALIPVIGAAVAIEPAHETWVLDGIPRLEVKHLVEGLGGRYLTGTINDAFESADVDVIGIIGADQIVTPDFLRHTLGYLDDPTVGAVQTAEHTGGPDICESEDGKLPPERDSARCRIVFPARNRWNAVHWEGTRALIRVDAARSVRDLASDIAGFEVRASIRMHKQGWRIVAHNEVLVRSLAPYDALRAARERRLASVASRRAMRSERILTSSGLALSQRLAYITGAWPRLHGLRTLLFIAVPVAVLAGGSLPVAGDLHLFAPLAFGVAYIQYAGLRLLARGHYPAWREVVFGSPSIPAVVPTLGEFIRQSRPQLDSSVADGRTRDAPPWTLIGLMALSGSTLVWAALTLSGFTAVTYVNPWSVYGTAVFLGAELTLLVAAMQRVFYPVYRHESRAAVRFDVDLAAQVDDLAARVVDLSLTGAGIRMRGEMGADPWAQWTNDAFQEGQSVRLDLPLQGIALEAQVVRLAVGDRGVIEVGLEFRGGQWPAVHELAVVLFHGDLFPSESGPVREHIHLLEAV